MAPLPKPTPAAGPLAGAWIEEGRWAGDKRFSLHDHECDRALWLAARWSRDRGCPVKRMEPWRPWSIAAVSGPIPPVLDGAAASLLCGSCPRRDPCQGRVPLAKNCRTCTRVIADEGWFCGLDGAELTVEQQQTGCEAWNGVEP